MKLVLALVSAALAFVAPATASARSVFWLNLDELSSYDILDAKGNIYRERFPGLAAVASEATFFRNHTTVADNTHSAIPAALTGQRPVGKQRKFVYSKTLFAYLPRKSRVRVVEPVTDVCVRAPRCSLASPRPVTRLGAVHLSSPGFAAGDRRTDHATGLPKSGGMITSVSGRDTFWFNHVLLPHAPWRYLPNGDQYHHREKIPGIRNDMWVDRESAVRLGEQRMLLQAQLGDRMVLALRNRLRKRGIWNSSLVIITADHGGSFRPGFGRRRPSRSNFSDITNIPLIVKFPGQDRAQVSDELTNTLDLMPTVLEYLNVRGPAGREGRALQEISGFGASRVGMSPAALRRLRAPGAPGTGRGSLQGSSGTAFGRTTYTTRAGYPDGASMAFSLEGMVRERSRSVATLQRRFPFASPLLEGLPVPRSVGTSKVTARIANRRYLRNSRPGSGRLPAAFLSGNLSEPPNGRKLRFVVNGNGAVSGDSWRAGRTGRFSVMLPGLRRGSNRVSIFISSPAGWLKVPQR